MIHTEWINVLRSMSPEQSLLVLFVALVALAYDVYRTVKRVRAFKKNSYWYIKPCPSQTE